MAKHAIGFSDFLVRHIIRFIDGRFPRKDFGILDAEVFKYGGGDAERFALIAVRRGGSKLPVFKGRADSLGAADQFSQCTPGNGRSSQDVQILVVPMIPAHGVVEIDGTPKITEHIDHHGIGGYQFKMLDGRFKCLKQP